MNNGKHRKATHCSKMASDSLAKNTPNAPEFICPICQPKPISSAFQWKKASLVRAFVHFIPSCLGLNALLKRPINQLKPDQQRGQKVLRAYCPNIYTVPVKALWAGKMLFAPALCSFGIKWSQTDMAWSLGWCFIPGEESAKEIRK